MGLNYDGFMTWLGNPKNAPAPGPQGEYIDYTQIPSTSTPKRFSLEGSGYLVVLAIVAAILIFKKGY